jgi:hypothetical protein
VAGLVRRWLSGWRGVEIDMRSPLPIEEVRARLQAGVKGRWRAAASLGPGGFDGRRVIGRVRDDSIRIEAGKATIRNSWRPVARCDLDPDPGGAGCRLTGTLRAPWFVLVFSAIWLGGVCLFVVIGVLATIVALVTGHAREAGAPAAVAGAGVGFFVLGTGLIGVGFALGRKDGEFLLTWLADELQVTGPPRD